jgi:hypothetical protein
LLYSDGFTIRGVQKLLKEKGPRHIAAVGRGASLMAAPEPVPERIVVEKIVYVEKPAEAPAKKRGTHLRAVGTEPPPMSLPFFERAVEEQPVAHLRAEERAKLTRLLSELEGLKRRLKTARR